jgi:hypothetical protein
MNMNHCSINKEDKKAIFNNQRDNGLFSAVAVETSALNYLDRLNRKRLDVLASPAERRAARLQAVTLEGKLYQYIREQTPLSILDADYKKEADLYILMRELFLRATDFTFKRHRFTFLLELIRFYRDDPCSILVGREAILKKWEKQLLYDYLLLDMGKKNTENIGKEAISNGYHECDYTLEIEEVWKQPTKSIPRAYFNYVCRSIPTSQIASCVLAYMKTHINEMLPSLWVVDATAIWEQYEKGPTPSTTNVDMTAVAATYKKK